MTWDVKIAVMLQSNFMGKHEIRPQHNCNKFYVFPYVFSLSAFSILYIIMNCCLLVLQYAACVCSSLCAYNCTVCSFHCANKFRINMWKIWAVSEGNQWGMLHKSSAKETRTSESDRQESATVWTCIPLAMASDDDVDK